MSCPGSLSSAADSYKGVSHVTQSKAVSSLLHSCQSLFPQPTAQLAVAVAWVGRGGEGRGQDVVRVGSAGLVARLKLREM